MFPNQILRTTRCCLITAALEPAGGRLSNHTAHISPGAPLSAYGPCCSNHTTYTLASYPPAQIACSCYYISPAQCWGRHWKAAARTAISIESLKGDDTGSK
ncbi:hypothetical protein F4823DRAFT_316373 [Ustulina deusta]|nr:hypothetical protein F4823DRAFT_316373 [Ustulina deusta]